MRGYPSVQLLAADPTPDRDSLGRVLETEYGFSSSSDVGWE
jgi:hypothetical protein